MTTVGRLEIAHPLLNASGTWDAVEAQRLFGEANPGMAGFVTKTVTAEPRPGNPAPRIAPSRMGLLNSIGLPGPGRDAFLGRDGTWLWPTHAVVVDAHDPAVVVVLAQRLSVDARDALGFRRSGTALVTLSVPAGGLPAVEIGRAHV